MLVQKTGNGLFLYVVGGPSIQLSVSNSSAICCLSILELQPQPMERDFLFRLFQVIYVLYVFVGVPNIYR